LYTFILTSLLDLSKFDFFHIHMDFCNPVRIHGMKINMIRYENMELSPYKVPDFRHIWRY